MVEEELVVETTTGEALAEILGTGERNEPTPDPATGSWLTLREAHRGRGFGFGEVATLVLHLLEGTSVSVSSSLLAAWLLKQFSGRARNVKRAEKVYRVTKDELERLVRDILEQNAKEKPF
jgi:hypothetical protein